MKEQLIIFKTAKLAKEKGFDEVCHSYFIVWRGNLRKCHEDNEDKALIVNSIIDDNIYSRQGNYVLEECKNSYSKDYITTPTQSFLQKWLRKKHKLHIEIIVKSCGFYYYNIKKYTGIENGWVLISTSKEVTMAARTNPAVLEEALQEALKLI